MVPSSNLLLLALSRLHGTPHHIHPATRLRGRVKRIAGLLIPRLLPTLAVPKISELAALVSQEGEIRGAGSSWQAAAAGKELFALEVGASVTVTKLELSPDDSLCPGGLRLDAAVQVSSLRSASVQWAFWGMAGCCVTCL